MFFRSEHLMLQCGKVDNHRLHLTCGGDIKMSPQAPKPCVAMAVDVNQEWTWNEQLIRMSIGSWV
jgi:hypothetical protein